MKNKQSAISRREFIAKTGTFAAVLSIQTLPTAMSVTDRAQSENPNILIIVTDHTAQKAVGAYGNAYAQTQNIDQIAAEGIRFSKVYSTCPLCQPSRASLWTSRYPHETSVRSNESSEQIPVDMPTLGETFFNSGYETYHAGKTHDAGSLRGFSIESVKEAAAPQDMWSQIYNYDTKRDEYSTTKMVEFIKKTHEKPFLAVLDLHNPHNICNYVGYNEKNGDKPNQPEIANENLPPLPDNFVIEDLESRPLPIQYLCCTHPRLWQASNWSERNYQHYLAAFNHFQNLADTKIGEVIDALKETNLYDSTLIVYTADHGDGLAAHRMITKHLSFYEETTRVPLIFRGPGITKPGSKIDAPLVSLLDILPTLCDYAGLAIPEGVRGKSLLSFLSDQNPDEHHDYVVSQWHKEYNTVKRNPLFATTKHATLPGRMIRTERFKYIRYIEEQGEEIYDLEYDPEEKKNIILEESYRQDVETLRLLMKAYLQKTSDDFFSLQVDVDPGFRGSHELGYENHYPLSSVGTRTDPKNFQLDLEVERNPFKFDTIINYQLPGAGNVSVKVSDIMGRQVIELVNEWQLSGIHSINWQGIDSSGKDVASGCYFCTIRFNHQIITRKLSLLK